MHKLKMVLPSVAAVILALVVSAIGVGVEPAFAVPPTNDGFAAATAVTDANLPFTDSLSTVDATFEGSEPEPFCASTGPHTVWYAFTPSVEVTVAADTFGSAYDTVLAAYTGTSLFDIVAVDCVDDSGGFHPRILFTATAGTTVFLQVGGFAGDSGDLVFNLLAEFVHRPSENADGSGQTNLTNDAAFDAAPTWSPIAIAEPTPTPEPAEPTSEPVEPTPEPVEPTPTPIAATGDGDGAPVGAIVGGVLGGVLLLAVGGGAGYSYLRIRKT